MANLQPLLTSTAERYNWKAGSNVTRVLRSSGAFRVQLGLVLAIVFRVPAASVGCQEMVEGPAGKPRMRCVTRI